MGPSLGTSLDRSSTVAEPSPPRPTPSPHLLSCGAVLGGPRPPNRLLYDPCPMAGGRHSWSQWRWLHWGPHKITPPYHSGPSARHSCWWTLGNPGTHSHTHTREYTDSVPLVSHTEGRRSASLWCMRDLVSKVDEVTLRVFLFYTLYPYERMSPAYTRSKQCPCKRTSVCTLA